MGLADLIQRKKTATVLSPATATFAIPATVTPFPADIPPSVATVATVAVADSANDGPDPITATTEQADELRELVALILADDTEADRAEALAVAFVDPDAALTSFRALVADLETAPPEQDADNRRPCTDCANLTPRDRRCLAA